MISDDFDSLADLSPTLGITELLPILRKFKKNSNSVFLSNNERAKEKVKITVLCSFSLQHFSEILRLYLAGSNIDCEIYDAGFDNMNFELMDEGSGLHDFNPDFVVFISHYRDIKFFPNNIIENNDFEECLDLHVAKLQMYWNKAKKLGVSKIFQTNYVKPIERQLGNIDNALHASRSNFIHSINDWMSQNAGNDVGILDFEYIA